MQTVIKKNSHSVGEQFTDKAIGQMPEVSRTNLFDIENISQLTDHCFDEASCRHVCRTKDLGRFLPTFLWKIPS